MDPIITEKFALYFFFDCTADNVHFCRTCVFGGRRILWQPRFCEERWCLPALLIATQSWQPTARLQFDGIFFNSTGMLCKLQRKRETSWWSQTFQSHIFSLLVTYRLFYPTLEQLNHLIMSTILDLMNNPAPKDFCNKKKVSRDFLVELIGTTLFVYAGTLSAVSTGAKLVAQGNVAEGVARILPIAVTFGVSILSMAYSIGHLSGCHLNPGVSLMMFFRRKMSIHKMLSYWIAQLVGALAGAALVRTIPVLQSILLYSTLLGTLGIRC